MSDQKYPVAQMPGYLHFTPLGAVLRDFASQTYHANARTPADVHARALFSPDPTGTVHWDALTKLSDYMVEHPEHPLAKLFDWKKVPEQVDHDESLYPIVHQMTYQPYLGLYDLKKYLNGYRPPIGVNSTAARIAVEFRHKYPHVTEDQLLASAQRLLNRESLLRKHQVLTDPNFDTDKFHDRLSAAFQAHKKVKLSRASDIGSEFGSHRLPEFLQFTPLGAVLRDHAAKAEKAVTDDPSAIAAHKLMQHEAMPGGHWTELERIQKHMLAHPEHPLAKLFDWNTQLDKIDDDVNVQQTVENSACGRQNIYDDLMNHVTGTPAEELVFNYTVPDIRRILQEKYPHLTDERIRASITRLKGVHAALLKTLPAYGGHHPDRVHDAMSQLYQRHKNVKLARMKAPAGGMIVNNTFQQGGQFLAKPLKKIRSTVFAWLKAKKKLARSGGEKFPATSLPEYLWFTPLGAVLRDFASQTKAGAPRTAADQHVRDLFTPDTVGGGHWSALNKLADEMKKNPEHPLAKLFDWNTVPRKVDLDSTLSSHVDAPPTSLWYNNRLAEIANHLEPGSVKSIPFFNPRHDETMQTLAKTRRSVPDATDAEIAASARRLLERDRVHTKFSAHATFAHGSKHFPNIYDHPDMDPLHDAMSRAYQKHKKVKLARPIRAKDIGGDFSHERLPAYLQFTPLGAVLRDHAAKAERAYTDDPSAVAAHHLMQPEAAPGGHWTELQRIRDHMLAHPEHPLAKLFDWNTQLDKIDDDESVRGMINRRTSGRREIMEDLHDAAKGVRSNDLQFGSAAVTLKNKIQEKYPHITDDRLRASMARLLARYDARLKPIRLLVTGDDVHDGLSELYQRHKKVRLARPTAVERATEQMPGHMAPVLAAVGFDPNTQDRLTTDQVKQIEDVHQIPDALRLSTKPNATRADRERFFDALVNKRHDVATLRKTLLSKKTKPDVALAYLVPHLVAESNFYAGANGALNCYTSDVDKMEHGVSRIMNWSADDPRHTLLKAIVAATSSGQEPVANIPNAIRMVEQAGGDFRVIPHAQEKRLAEFLAKHPAIAAHAGLTPHDWHQWWLAHDKPELKDAAFRSRPAYVVNRPGHPDHEKLISYELKRGTYTTVPGMGKYTGTSQFARDNRSVAALPVVDPKTGRVLAKAWTQQGSKILSQNLNDLRHIIDHFGGDLGKTSEWLLTDHPRDEFAAVVGKPFVDKDEVLKKEDPVPGMFFMGPKKGAFALNLHQNKDPKHGRFLTADVWWTRTWNRLQGIMFHTATGLKKAKALETPRSKRERKLMWAAAQLAATRAGLPSVADLQANLWYYEQHLDRWFGGDASSTGVVDGINRALDQRGMTRLSRPKSITGALGARAARLKAEGKLVPPGKLLLTMMQAHRDVFAAVKRKLARPGEQYEFRSEKMPHYLQFTPLGAVLRDYASKSLHAAPADPVPRMAHDFLSTGYWDGLMALQEHLLKNPEHPLAKLFDWNQVPKKVDLDSDIHDTTARWRSVFGKARPYLLTTQGAYDALREQLENWRQTPWSDHARELMGKLRERHSDATTDDILSSLKRLTEQHRVRQKVYKMPYSNYDKENKVHDAMSDAYQAHKGVKLARKRAPYNVAYVSPSQRENSTVQQAMEGLASPEMQMLESMTPGGRSGVGFWIDGAEESRLVPGADDRLAAALGKKFRQKGVITFREDPNGPDRAHVLFVPHVDPEKLYKTLQRHGIQYATVFPSGSVHILDSDGSLEPNVVALPFKRRTVRGHVRFIGADDREAAQAEYNKLLKLARAPKSRLRQFIDHHYRQKNPDALRRLATGPFPALKSLFHHIANQLDLNRNPDEIEAGINQWRQRRGYTEDQVKLARDITGTDLRPRIPESEWDNTWINLVNGRGDPTGRQLAAAAARLPDDDDAHATAERALRHGDMTAFGAMIDHLHENGYIDEPTAARYHLGRVLVAQDRFARFEDALAHVRRYWPNDEKVLAAFWKSQSAKRPKKLARPVIANPQTFPVQKMAPMLRFTPLGAALRHHAGQAMHATATDPVAGMARNYLESGGWSDLTRLSEHLVNNPEHPLAKLFDWEKVPEQVDLDAEVNGRIERHPMIMQGHPRLGLDVLNNRLTGKQIHPLHQGFADDIIRPIREKYPNVTADDMRRSVGRLRERDRVSLYGKYKIGEEDKFHDRMHAALVEHRKKNPVIKAGT